MDSEVSSVSDSNEDDSDEDSNDDEDDGDNNDEEDVDSDENNDNEINNNIFSNRINAYNYLYPNFNSIQDNSTEDLNLNVASDIENEDEYTFLRRRHVSNVILSDSENEIDSDQSLEGHNSHLHEFNNSKSIKRRSKKNRFKNKFINYEADDDNSETCSTESNTDNYNSSDSFIDDSEYHTDAHIYLQGSQ